MDARPRPLPDGGDPGPTARTLSQSTDNTILQGNAKACVNGDNHHSENSYYRVYDMVGLGINGAFTVTSVDVGIETASGSGGTQPASVKLYTLSGNFVLANLMLLTSVDLVIENQTLTVLNVPIDNQVIPGGATMVVELLTPDGRGTDETFFIGSNTAGESAPTFVRAPVCGVTQPIDADGAPVNAPNMNIVLNVNGTLP